MNELAVIDKRFTQLGVDELYAIIGLRSEVFVVEQACPYSELDGRDHEPGTRHLWFHDEDAPPYRNIAAYLRILVDPDALRVGRVVTAPPWRGSGLARQLMDHALATTSGPIVLDAQVYLEDFYASLGFVVVGPEFVEDGIPHLPMRLARSDGAPGGPNPARPTV